MREWTLLSNLIIRVNYKKREIIILLLIKLCYTLTMNMPWINATIYGFYLRLIYYKFKDGDLLSRNVCYERRHGYMRIYWSQDMSTTK